MAHTRILNHTSHPAIGPAIAIRKDVESPLRPMSSLLNRMRRDLSYTIMALRRRGEYEAAIDNAYTMLSDMIPGYYFGLMGHDERGWLVYGWMPQEMEQSDERLVEV